MIGKSKQLKYFLKSVHGNLSTKIQAQYFSVYVKQGIVAYIPGVKYMQQIT